MNTIRPQWLDDLKALRREIPVSPLTGVDAEGNERPSQLEVEDDLLSQFQGGSGYDAELCVEVMLLLEEYTLAHPKLGNVIQHCIFEGASMTEMARRLDVAVRTVYGLREKASAWMREQRDGRNVRALHPIHVKRDWGGPSPDRKIVHVDNGRGQVRYSRFLVQESKIAS